jgi:hypothetical protein
MLVPKTTAGCELNQILAEYAGQEAKSGHYLLSHGLVSSQLKHTIGLEVGTDSG